VAFLNKGPRVLKMKHNVPVDPQSGYKNFIANLKMFDEKNYPNLLDEKNVSHAKWLILGTGVTFTKHCGPTWPYVPHNGEII